MKFLLIGLCVTLANAITHNSGYNYPPNNAAAAVSAGFVPNNGPCCQELALLKQQLVQQQQQLQQLQQQQQGRIVHKQEITSSSLNTVHDGSVAGGHSKGYTHHTQGPVIGNAEFSGTKVFNYHSQGPLAGGQGQIHYIHNHHPNHQNQQQHQQHQHQAQKQNQQAQHSGHLSSASLAASVAHVATSGNKGYNYQNQGNKLSTAGGQVVQGHLLVGGHGGPVNGPSAAQQIANKYSAHATNSYNTAAATTILKPPAPQGGFTVSQTASGYNTDSNANYNGAASQHYATTTKLTSQGSQGGSYASGSGSSSISGSSAGFNGNYAGSASDKTYTQTQVVNSNEFNLGGSASGVAGQVEKHIYVHVPPEDFSDSAEERSKLQQLIQPKKHYKIIFIKAPTVSAGPNYQQLLSQGGATQEKTLVYVLVKKPDEPSAEEIAAIQNQSVKHNKPEVFFIKYKTRKEAEQAVQALGQQGNNQFLGNFVGSDLGVDVRNAGSIQAHESLASVASAIETAETYSTSSGSSSSSGSADLSSSYIPPPKPAPVYGVPAVKK